MNDVPVQIKLQKPFTIFIHLILTGGAYSLVAMNNILCLTKLIYVIVDILARLPCFGRNTFIYTKKYISLKFCPLWDAFPQHYTN